MSLFAELRRRKVFRVAIAYFAGSWLLIQVAETLLPVYGIGDAAIRTVVVVLAICAAPVMVISWLYQFTPNGLRKQYDIDHSNSPTSETESLPTEVVLAVLPFDNLSTDPDLQFFSDGVSEEIIHRLSRGTDLKLIGRTSSFQFRDERKAEAARTLNCSHVLDGSIRRAAGRVRISAHLVETSSRTSLWSDRFDCSLEDIFSVQDEISEDIAGALNQAFLRFSSQVVDPAVYDLYLRASLKSYAPEELRINVGLLEVATERAPHFAEAWARLAFARAWLRFYQPFAERAASGAKLEHAAERALAFDPQNVDALVAKLLLVAPFGRFVEADAALDGLRQAPGIGDGKKIIGYLMRNVGHLREGLEFPRHDRHFSG